jgi:hypothetical protein
VIHTIEVDAKLTMLAVAALLVYAASLYRYPFRPCIWCKGTGRNKGSNARRFGHCWRCAHTGRVQRLGSKSVHRLAWAIRGELARSRARKAALKAERRSAHPRDLTDRNRNP